jgi:hypothetical protein
LREPFKENPFPFKKLNPAASSMNPLIRTLLEAHAEKSASLSPQFDEASTQAAFTAPVAMAGDISAIAIENIFQLLDLAALTGKLELQSASNSGIFYFRKGLLVHGLLQISHRKIGQIFLDAQVITNEQLQECLRLHEQTGTRRRVGQILLEKGYIKPEWLNKTLSRQVKEAFFEALSWQEGTFRFYLNQIPPPDEIEMHGRIDRLLLEGMVRIDQDTQGGNEE